MASIPLSSKPDRQSFVMKRFFPNYDEKSKKIRGLESRIYMIGETEQHVGVPWRITAQNRKGYVFFELECMKSQQANSDWLIEAEVELKCILEKEENRVVKKCTHLFSEQASKVKLLASFRNLRNQEKFVKDLNLNVEVTVRIKRLEKVQTALRLFNESVQSDDQSIIMTSVSKFSKPDRQSFVMKRFFPNYEEELKNYRILESRTYLIGETGQHFGVPWRITARSYYGFVIFDLECMKSQQANFDWLIEAEVELKCILEEEENRVVKKCTHLFSEEASKVQLLASFRHLGNQEKFVRDLNLNVEVAVRIKRVEKVQTTLRLFDESTQSDVILIVQGKKFFVLKELLALHSTFFDRLLFGPYKESTMPEIELKGIDPYHLQKFLELVYGEACVNDHTVLDLLNLADYLDSQTAITHCEEFLLNTSDHSIDTKMLAANEYNMKRLKAKCASTISANESVGISLHSHCHSFSRPV